MEAAPEANAAEGGRPHIVGWDAHEILNGLPPCASSPLTAISALRELRRAGAASAMKIYTGNAKGTWGGVPRKRGLTTSDAPPAPVAWAS